MKCPICGNKYRGITGTHHSQICLHGAKDYIKYIGQLQDELSVSEVSLTQCELRRKQEEEEIERLKKEVEHWKEEGRKAAELYV